MSSLQRRPWKNQMSSYGKKRCHGVSQVGGPNKTYLNQRSVCFYSQHVHTPINVVKLEQELQNHPDQNFKTYLVSGLKSGFHTGLSVLPSNSIQCKNLRSATSNKESVFDLIQSEVDKGYIYGPFKEIPYANYRINPIGIAEGKYSKKKRLIVDLSAPHEDVENPSLNELIDKDQYSLNYVSIDDAIKIIKHLGKGAMLIKTDITDAFKTLPLSPEMWPFHGIKWDDYYYFYNRLVFGCRSSPKIFDNLSTAVCW